MPQLKSQKRENHKLRAIYMDTSTDIPTAYVPANDRVPRCGHCIGILIGWTLVFRWNNEALRAEKFNFFRKLGL